MRRLMSIGTTFIIALSITACANRNTALNNPNGTTGDSNVTPITQRYSAPNYSQIGTYNDGVFKGEGVRVNNVLETAVVTIRDGLIDNIELSSVNITGDNQENVITGTDTNNTGNVIVAPTPVITPGTYTNNGTTIAPGVTPGTITDNGNIATPGVTPGTITGAGAGTNNTTTGSPALEEAKKQLINNVINQQTADINITADGPTKATIDNWKIAIQKALDKASK